MVRLGRGLQRDVPLPRAASIAGLVIAVAIGALRQHPLSTILLASVAALLILDALRRKPQTVRQFPLWVALLTYGLPSVIALLV